MHYSTVTAGILGFAVCATLTAQGPRLGTTATGARPCAVATCALEIRRGLFFAVIARADGSQSSRIGFSGASVVRAVDGVPDAMDEARAGHRQLIKSNWAAALAVGVLSAGLISTYRGVDDDGVLLSLSILPLGLAGGWYSSVQRRKSVASFDRAVWLYNRELIKPTGPR
jgi:hypothetical protein